MPEHFANNMSGPDSAPDPIPEPDAEAIAPSEEEELPAGFPLPDGWVEQIGGGE